MPNYKNHACFSILCLMLLTWFAPVMANSIMPEAAIEPSVGLMSLTQAAVLGLVEGVTEYLPISSTGHLILVDRWLGLRSNSNMTESQIDAIHAFDIVIQGGAILAVLYAYFGRVRRMILGLLGRDLEGRKLFMLLLTAFVPAMIIGLLLHKLIKTHLQSEWPTVYAMAVGGVVMILFEKTKLAKKRRESGFDINSLTIKSALVIGLMQCIAMWPGTSRSMMTILGGMMVGLSPIAAAEFSFLLGLPTLLAATVFKATKYGDVLLEHVGIQPIALGMCVAAVSAFFCVKGLTAWLSKNGLAPFGWYRLFLAAVAALVLSQ
jgi:undecaprenyl-diphosphatase